MNTDRGHRGWDRQRPGYQPKQPMQETVVDDGAIRFHKNAIVAFLLDAGPFNMNQLAMMPFSDQDREQFAQLIGYSLSGFSELSYASDEAVAEAENDSRIFLEPPK